MFLSNAEEVKTDSEKLMSFLWHCEDVLETDAFYGDEDNAEISILDVDDRLQIVISVNDDTTHDQVRAAIPYALTLRDVLVDWQGKSESRKSRLLNVLNQYHRKGVSYAKLAQTVNKLIKEHLRDYLKLEQEQEDFSRHFQEYRKHTADDESTQIVYLLKNRPPQPVNKWFDAKDTIMAFGIKRQEALSFIEFGLNRMREGLEPFEPGYPIGRDNVIRKCFKSYVD